MLAQVNGTVDGGGRGSVHSTQQPKYLRDTAPLLIQLETNQQKLQLTWQQA